MMHGSMNIKVLFYFVIPPVVFFFVQLVATSITVVVSQCNFIFGFYINCLITENIVLF